VIKSSNERWAGSTPRAIITLSRSIVLQILVLIIRCIIEIYYLAVGFRYPSRKNKHKKKSFLFPRSSLMSGWQDASPIFKPLNINTLQQPFLVVHHYVHLGNCGKSK